MIYTIVHARVFMDQTVLKEINVSEPSRLRTAGAPAMGLEFGVSKIA